MKKEKTKTNPTGNPRTHRLLKAGGAAFCVLLLAFIAMQITRPSSMAEDPVSESDLAREEEKEEETKKEEKKKEETKLAEEKKERKKEANQKTETKQNAKQKAQPRKITQRTRPHHKSGKGQKHEIPKTEQALVLTAVSDDETSGGPRFFFAGVDSLAEILETRGPGATHMLAQIGDTIYKVDIDNRTARPISPAFYDKLKKQGLAARLIPSEDLKRRFKIGETEYIAWKIILGKDLMRAMETQTFLQTGTTNMGWNTYMIAGRDPSDITITRLKAAR